MQSIVKAMLLFTSLVVMCRCQEPVSNFLPVEPPKFYLQDPSPLRNRESLRKPEYFDFLNTLYRHDRTKSNLFEGNPVNPINPVFSSKSNLRRKRAIVFRPLFVYRQQQIRKQQIRQPKQANSIE